MKSSPHPKSLSLRARDLKSSAFLPFALREKGLGDEGWNSPETLPKMILGGEVNA
jgi:hypothetical protein